MKLIGIFYIFNLFRILICVAVAFQNMSLAKAENQGLLAFVPEYVSYANTFVGLYMSSSLFLTPGLFSSVLFLKWWCKDVQENRKLLPRAVLINLASETLSLIIYIALMIHVKSYSGLGTSS